MRKRTNFQLCENHKSWGKGRNAAEMVVEGGPGIGEPCAPKMCRVLPGEDYYIPTCTDREFEELIENWAVNKGRMS